MEHAIELEPNLPETSADKPVRAVRPSLAGERSAFGRWPQAKPRPRQAPAYLLPERPRLDRSGRLIQRTLAVPARCPGCDGLLTMAPCLACYVRGE